MTSLSIIVASSGRPTLSRTIESARGQMRDGDEILVSVNQDCPWGHAARNQLMGAARGDALLFMDDDDAYLPGALNGVRAAFEAEPSRMHLFRMRYFADGRELWADREVRCGNVSTQMVVVPRMVVMPRTLPGGRPQWAARYEGDFDFIAMAAAKLGEPVWHEQTIALIRPL